MTVRGGYEAEWDFCGTASAGSMRQAEIWETAF